jgi:hypothetical protein
MRFCRRTAIRAVPWNSTTRHRSSSRRIVVSNCSGENTRRGMSFRFALRRTYTVFPLVSFCPVKKIAFLCDFDTGRCLSL